MSGRCVGEVCWGSVEGGVWEVSGVVSGRCVGVGSRGKRRVWGMRGACVGRA